MSSQAYTPGLKVKEYYIVKKTRRLPMPGEVFYKQRDQVSFDSIVARTSIPGPLHIIDVCAKLGVEPEDIKKYMKIDIGENIKTGEQLAYYQALFGLIKAVCLSPIEGNLELISSATGQAMLRETPVPINLTAYIPGIIKQVIPNEGVVIETPASYIQGILGIGGEAHGIIKILAKKPEDEVKSSDITEEFKNKLMVCGSLINSEFVKKAIEIGVSGIVAGGITGSDLNHLIGEELGVIITGQENLGLTLIFTEGFGKIPMQKKTFELLKLNEGNLACFNGATQVRAGVVRPEIIIPLFHIENNQNLNNESENYDDKGITIGTNVRIIQDPNFGAVGKVVNLPIQLYKLESESYVRVLHVQLNDGKTVTVPRANVEIIEE